MKKTPKTHRLVVPPERAGERLDRLVVDLPDVGSRRRARHAIETGKVSREGIACGPDDVGRKIKAGTVITISWGKPGTGKAGHEARQGMRQAGLEVLYEDDWLVAVNKPPGLLTDTANRRQSMTRDSLRARLQRYLRARGDTGFIVHRIDRDTSGVVLVARTQAANDILKRQFRERSPERVYLMVVHGIPDPAQGQWDDWMAWDSPNRIQRVTPAEAKGAVLAQARYRTVRRFGTRAALIEVRLISGRRNQIRLHASTRSHPLYGERLYLPDDWRPSSRPLIDRQALHARALEVFHPGQRKTIRFEAPVPDDFQRLLNTLGGSNKKGE